MAKAMFKPDAQLDGQEFSALTRLLEELHQRKEAGVDQDALESAKDAQAALMANSFVGEDDLKALVDAVKQYADAVENDKLGVFPNVKGLELKRVLKKLEGMSAQQETKDENGNKVHPAAMPAGKEPEKAPHVEPGLQQMQIVDTPETLKAKQEELEKFQKEHGTPVENDNKVNAGSMKK